MSISEIVQQYQPVAGMAAQGVSTFAPVHKVDENGAFLPAQKSQKEEKDIEDVVLISDKANKISDADKKGDFALVDKMMAEKEEDSETLGNMASAYSPKLLGQKPEEKNNGLTLPSEKREEQNQAEKPVEENKDNTKQVKDAELSSKEKQVVAQLKSIDAEVRAHEQAHIAAAGSGVSASAASFEYEKGPDGNKYAVAGEVNISYQMGSNHKENIQIARNVKNAALAPASPSAQDKAVARHADQMIFEEMKEITKEKLEENIEEDNAEILEEEKIEEQDDNVENIKTDKLQPQDTNNALNTKNLIDAPVKNIKQQDDKEVGVLVSSTDISFEKILKQEQEDIDSFIEDFRKSKTVVEKQQEEDADVVKKNFHAKNFDSNMINNEQNKNNYINFLNLPVSLV
ncbi:MAG: hypothetical protein MJ229_02380 [bacterium]|nr:hypothetical protein [bacterium]